MKRKQSLTLDSRTERSLMSVAAALAMIPLAACLGGGGGSGGGGSVADTAPMIEPDSARTLTGGESPIETLADQRARAPAIIQRADSLIVYTITGETSHPDAPSFSLRTNCSRTSCQVTQPRTGISIVVDLDDLQYVSGDSRTVLTRNGITVVDETASIDDAIIKDYRGRAYSAWMEHAVFAAQVERGNAEGIDFVARYAIAGGDLTGTMPNVAAIWNGLMVGRTRSGDNTLQGDAL